MSRCLLQTIIILTPENRIQSYEAPNNCNSLRQFHKHIKNYILYQQHFLTNEHWWKFMAIKICWKKAGHIGTEF